MLNIHPNAFSMNLLGLLTQFEIYNYTLAVSQVLPSSAVFPVYGIPSHAFCSFLLDRARLLVYPVIEIWGKTLDLVLIQSEMIDVGSG